MAKIMPHVRHCCKAYPDVNEPYAHCRCASDERLIFNNITRCYGKQVTVFAVAIAAGDIIKYQSFVYGSFVWEIHVRYNKNIYIFSIAEGVLNKHTRGRNTERHVFLFDALIVLCKQNLRRASVSGPMGEFKLKEKFNIRKISVRDKEDCEGMWIWTFFCKA